ncbi:hypothetical protein ACFYPT_41770 [Streptomyces sp. NPDC005529]
MFTHAQWAKNFGRSFTAVCHWAWAFIRPRSRLYFSRDHRIT